MKKKTLFAIFMMSSVFLFGQDAIVTGLVSDNGEPLIGASVYIEGTTKGAITNYDGRYQIALDAGTYMISANYLGYNKQEQEVTLTAGEERELNFELTEGLMVDEVVVTGTRASNRTNLDRSSY